MKIAELLKENTTLKKFGISMEVPSARIKVITAVERNNDDSMYNISYLPVVFISGYFMYFFNR